MIHFVLGGFGSGKSYSGLRMIRAELLNGIRPVVTNLAVNEKDFAEYFAKKFPKAHVRLHQRLRLLTDEEVPQFYLHRLSKAGLWYDIAPPDPDAEKRGARPDWTRWRDNGVLFVIEEAHEFFNARYWQEVGRCFGAYKNQNRKFGDDVIFITPQITEIDKQLRTSGQTYTQLSNLGMRKVHGIRLPPLFLAREYSAIPDRSSTALNNYTYGLDLDLAKCYDTAKGVRGVQGLLADKERKKKGVPLWLVLTVATLVLCVVGRFFLKIPAHIFGAIKAPPAPASASGSPGIRGLVDSVPVDQVVSVSIPAGGSQTETDGVTCVGYQLVGGDATVFLSDGTIFSSRLREVQKIYPRKVIVNGREYPVRSSFHPDYVPELKQNRDGFFDVQSKTTLQREPVRKERMFMP